MTDTPNLTVFPFDRGSIMRISSDTHPTFKVIEDPNSGIQYLLMLGDAAFKDVGFEPDQVASGTHTHIIRFTDLTDTPSSITNNSMLKSTTTGLEWVPAAGTVFDNNNHYDLNALSYEESGHTGFVATGTLVTVSGVLQVQIDNKIDIGSSYTTLEIDGMLLTLSGSIQSQLGNLSIDGGLWS